MNGKSLGGLIVLNVFLLIVLGVLSFGPQPVDAQIRRGGDYLMIAGKTPGRLQNTVYVADLNNAAVLGITYDQGRRSLIFVGGRDIAGDFAATPGR